MSKLYMKKRNYIKAIHHLDRYLESMLRNQILLKNRIKSIKRIIELRTKNEKSLQKIGDEVGLTRERVRQILQRFGITGTREHLKMKKS